MTRWNTYKAQVAERQVMQFDRQFLPAVIELQETPPNPVALLFLKGICAAITLTLLWSILGTVDIVAIGEGKTVPTGRVKVVQPLEAGVITAINVEDGQAVKKGDVLVTLDVTLTEADEARLRDEELRLTADRERLEALLAHRECPIFKDLPANLQAMQVSLCQETLTRNAAELATLEQELAQRQAELTDATQQIKRLKAATSLMAGRAERVSQLVKEGYYAKNRFALDETERLRLIRELETQEARKFQTEAAITGAEQRLNATKAEQRGTLLKELAEKEDRRATVTKELAKAVQRSRQQTLTAPIDGTVQELKVRTVGGVVTAAQELMKVVPFENALEAEIMIPNRDAGFVREGQAVAIKLEAFPFTKYGLLHGTVKTLSLDAIPDEKLGLLYAARVSIDEGTIDVGDRKIVLTSGLALTGEIQTGTRRIIEYFLSPLMEYADSAIKER